MGRREGERERESGRKFECMVTRDRQTDRQTDRDTEMVRAQVKNRQLARDKCMISYN